MSRTISRVYGAVGVGHNSLALDIVCLVTIEHGLWFLHFLHEFAVLSGHLLHKFVILPGLLFADNGVLRREKLYILL